MKDIIPGIRIHQPLCYHEFKHISQPPGVCRRPIPVEIEAVYCSPVAAHITWTQLYWKLQPCRQA